MISHFWPMTGKLIEYSQPPEVAFSENTSQLTCTWSLNPYAWVYRQVWKCERTCVWKGLTCLWLSVSSVTWHHIGADIPSVTQSWTLLACRVSHFFAIVSTNHFIKTEHHDVGFLRQTDKFITLKKWRKISATHKFPHLNFSLHSILRCTDKTENYEMWDDRWYL